MTLIGVTLPYKIVCSYLFGSVSIVCLLYSTMRKGAGETTSIESAVGCLCIIAML